MRRPRGLMRRLSRATFQGVVVAVSIVGMAYAVRARFDPVLHFDEGVIARATAVTGEHPRLRDALIVWQEVFQPWRIYAVATILCVVAWRRFDLRSRAVWAFATMMVAWFLALQIKLVVQRARPGVENAIEHAPGYSFPSGHAANVTVAAVILVLLFWPVLAPSKKRLAVTVSMLVVIVTDLDRVYLGVHYPSDVIAGSIFGVGLTFASFRGYLDWNPPMPETGASS